LAQAHISDYCDLAPGSEKELERAVNQQPIAVAIEADQPAFQMYSGGVLPVKKCGKALDHGVLLVGYGHDIKLKMDYWIVKNSWGGTWGEAGYIRLQKMVWRTKFTKLL
jgi:C1A family cysteine protease